MIQFAVLVLIDLGLGSLTHSTWNQTDGILGTTAFPWTMHGRPEPQLLVIASSNPSS